MSTQVRPVNVMDLTQGYTWRTDLQRTREHWEGWFRGMTGLFLSTHMPKQVILAGSDRMDREMMIA